MTKMIDGASKSSRVQSLVTACSRTILPFICFFSSIFASEVQLPFASFDRNIRGWERFVQQKLVTASELSDSPMGFRFLLLLESKAARF
jgi:hypothetical protein